MKVQQHRKHADAMPACGSQQHINVSQHPVVDAGWNAVIVETHSGSRIAQKEYSHDGNAVTSKRGEGRSEEHTSELQSRLHLVYRLLLEKKNKKIINC